VPSPPITRTSNSFAVGAAPGYRADAPAAFEATNVPWPRSSSCVDFVTL
jgi:hypothetical protein